MLIPSIDIMDGNAVQLIGGKEKKIDGGDPRVWAKRFARVGEIAVVDLDAALGRGDNRDVILELCKIASCRVGGGIRSVEDAKFWLNNGASSVVLGTAATPEILCELPRDRVIVALDCFDDQVVVKGWTEKTGRSVYDALDELGAYADSFLITFVEREGRLVGLDEARARKLNEQANSVGVQAEQAQRYTRITIAGGISEPAEVARLHTLGIDAQVGMALYEGRFDEADCLWAMAGSDREDGLVPTVVCDERGVALGLCYSNAESLALALSTGRGVYQSRKRGLWVKGETSGATQELLAVRLDCDSDTFKFTVRQSGGFCHLGRRSCFGAASGFAKLEQTLDERLGAPSDGSYTQKLLADDALLNAKIVEEAEELSAFDADLVWEAADLFYFAMVKLKQAGLSLTDVEREFDRRSQTIKTEKTQPSDRPILLRDAVFGGREPDTISKEVRRSAETIVDDVQNRGETALRFWSERFADLEPNAPWRFDRSMIEARATVEDATFALLERTRDRIAAFAEAQKAALSELVIESNGLRMGHTNIAVGSAGCYAPGGRYPLPSSVLMTVVTAKVAGVKRVVVASPKPTPETFAAALIAGADELIAVGGPQAIGALAYGIDSLEGVDVIVGPGNNYVTAAKKYVLGQVGIDMLAGPSELVVVADENADLDIVAADLIAQAEHDPDARPILIAFSRDTVTRVRECILAQLSTLETEAIASASLAAKGRAYIATDRDDAVRLCDAIAPEHLELLVDDPASMAEKLTNYGGLFIGRGAAEVLGDYGAGPNHVLPTDGTARFSSGLSVFDFLRTPTFISGNPAADLVEDVQAVATIERLFGHKRAAAYRK